MCLPDNYYVYTVTSCYSYIMFSLSLQTSLCVYLIVTMYILWASEVIMLPVTALMPLVSLSLSGMMTTGVATKCYINVSAKHYSNVVYDNVIFMPNCTKIEYDA